MTANIILALIAGFVVGVWLGWLFLLTLFGWIMRKFPDFEVE